MKIPFMSVGNEELNNQPELKAKDKVFCTACNSFHSVVSTKGNTFSIESITCKKTEKIFIVGLDGKLLKNKIKK